MKIKDIPAKEAVAVLHDEYGYSIDKYTWSKLMNPNKYGIRLTAKAELRLRSAKNARKDDFRTKPNKFTWRASDALKGRLQLVKSHSDETMQDLITRLVEEGLKNV